MLERDCPSLCRTLNGVSSLCYQKDVGKSDLQLRESLFFGGLNWNIFLSKEEPSSILTGSDFGQADLVQKKIYTASGPVKSHNGISAAHIDTMQLIVHRWASIVGWLRTIPNRKPQGLPIAKGQVYTEVNLRLSAFGEEFGHTLDCMGNDDQGNFYVIEIGRGNKTSQLAKQLYLARTIFPEVTINGVVAKYTQTDETNRRLFLRFI